MGLPIHLQGLLRPRAYPHPVGHVQVIETQLSWVLIAGERAYKIKRPVRFPFVDQRTLEERRLLCGEELRLNLRFAPQIYLDIAGIGMANGLARVDGPGEPIEFAVVMQAFDGSNELDQLVLHRRVRPPEIGDFGRWLADAHAGLPRRNNIMGEDSWRRAAAAAARNARACIAAAATFGTDPFIGAIAGQLAAEFVARKEIINGRAAGDFIRECHADLHLSNVVRLNNGLVPFDCLEFDAALRWIDVAQDAAFFYADLLGYDEPGLAASFLDAYLQGSGDYEACIVFPLYTADRALVRAKVLALQGREGQRSDAAHGDLLRRRHENYLRIASAALSAPGPCCVMMCGLPGSGKSWLAAQLAPEMSAITLRSDLERKRLAGLDALSRSDSQGGGGLYGADRVALVYRRLMHCAAAVLEGRRSVIVDANFGQREQRAELAELCHARGVPLVVVECHAPLPLLRQRIAARLARAHDPSEADLQVLELQIGAREPIASAEGLTVITADTSDVDVVPRVRDRLNRAARLQVQ